jgi:hypothetical protein
VEPGRVGGLGLSTGADVLIEVAAGSEEVAAVVSDGATGRSLADYLALDADDAVLGAPFYGMLTAAIEVITRSSPGRPLEELVPEVSPTPLLLVAAGGLASELDFNRVYARVANEPFEFWELRDVGHTAAVRERADEYEQKVVGFLDAALLR